jgi:hypothetical protein
MINKLKQQLVMLRNTILYQKRYFLAKLNHSQFRSNPDAQFMVSIASYPKRAHLLPAVFEALNEQTVLPKKWILVLSEEEWPNLILPYYLNKLINRGVEITWVQNNTFAVKKLVPVIEKYPDFAIVTLDDDILYHHLLLEGLIEKSLEQENTIVGYVGKALVKNGEELHMYSREKESASLNTSFHQVYLIGWGGIYYPPNSLHKKVLSIDKIRKIVPGRGSDIWFWAAAIANDTNQVCLGIPNNYNLGIPIPQNKHTRPKDQPKTDILIERFQMAIDYFGIREKLLDTLPNQD